MVYSLSVLYVRHYFRADRRRSRTEFEEEAMNSLHTAVLIWWIGALMIAIVSKPVSPLAYFWGSAAVIAYVAAEVVRLLREKP